MRRIKEQYTVDLRGYSAKALKRIKCISEVSLLILPKNADQEFFEQFAKIKIKCVANTIRLEDNIEIQDINGDFELSDNTVSMNGNSIYQVNGATIIRDLSSDKNISLLVNGSVIIHEPTTKNCNVNFISINGSLIRVQNTKFRYFPNKFELKKEDIEYFEEDMAIVCGNKLILDESITNEDLQNKKLFFVAGNKIVCSEKSISYVKANSQVGNKIVLGYNKVLVEDDD